MNVTYGVQSYAWGKLGKDSVVGKLKQSSDSSFTADDSERYAEMWIGTHPKCPSSVNGTPLREHIDEDLPFLLKVLSIDKALSIQAHPTIEHAIKLHAADPKNYPDPNHKPELLVAITPTEALACFRQTEEIIAFSKKHPTLALLSLENGDNEAAKLKALMEVLLSEEGSVAAKAHEERLRAYNGITTKEDQWFLKLSSQFPGDSGALMVYVLNLVALSPGQGVFLKPNEPHAYLTGDGVEIMAKSDNVVRAGLTPKFKDAPTLLGMMSYSPDAIKEMALGYNEKDATTTYQPPPYVSEFQLTMTKLGQGFPTTTSYTPKGDGVLLVVKGKVSFKAEGGAAGQAVPGSAVLVKKNVPVEVTLEGTDESSGATIEGDAVVFFSEANQSAA